MSTIEDELAIRNNLARLALLADGGDLGEYVDLFTADAVWDVPGSPPKQGRDEIRTGAHERRDSGMTGPGSNTRHLISTIAVAVDGDEARAESIFQFLAETTTAPRVQLMGHYADRWVRSADGWQLADRKITFG